MIRARKLSSGYWHVRGTGPCNWSQPPYWPCDDKTLRKHAFPEAGECFLLEAISTAREQLAEHWPEVEVCDV